MISLESISYKYPKTEKYVIKELSCAFGPGELTAVTGPNGCGKTTLTKLITGMLRPTGGTISVDGADTSAMDLFEIGQKIGYVFQDPSKQLFCQTVWEEITYGLKNMGLDEAQITQRAESYMEFFRLTRLREAFPGRLSQGERQRVMLAAVLAMGTGYVILDEPTSGLDMEGRADLGGLLTELKGRGKGVIIVSHERSFIESYADRELVLG